MENKYLYEGWRGFTEGSWVNEIDLRSFIRHNFTMYDGDETFLEGPTQNTLDLWDQVMDLTRQEREAGGVLDMDTKVISGITSHGPGYLNKEKESGVPLVSIGISIANEELYGELLYLLNYLHVERIICEQIERLSKVYALERYIEKWRESNGTL